MQKLSKKEIAEKIIKLEKEYQYNKRDKKEVEKEIYNLVSNLSLPDLLDIDEYIYINNFLTK